MPARDYSVSKSTMPTEVPTDVKTQRPPHADHAFVLQRVQPALLGLMDGSVSTLAPIFATAELTHRPMTAFFVGLAASIGAGISMGLAEALSDDGKVTGRGMPIGRGAITGVATAIGGMLHTFPFLSAEFVSRIKAGLRGCRRGVAGDCFDSVSLYA